MGVPVKNQLFPWKLKNKYKININFLGRNVQLPNATDPTPRKFLFQQVQVTFIKKSNHGNDSLY